MSHFHPHHLSRLIVLLFFMLIDTARMSPQCGLYGAPPCQFLPAPPGSTPACAYPGRTFCDHVPHYPTYVIKHLLQKYDIKSLLTDETGEDFNSLGYRNPVTVSQVYGPPPPPPPTHQPYGPQPQPHSEGYKYPTPNYNKQQQYNGNNLNGLYQESFGPEPIYIPRPQPYHSDHYKPHNQHPQQGGYSYYQPQQQVSHYNPDMDDDLDEAPSPFTIEQEFDANINGTKNRHKRQSPGRETLCQVRTEYITPQAALNSKGNWMYLVNKLDQARQLVKAETCTSTVCANLCQLPNGYNSRCEQKYVQKRLVALDGSGQRLYMDTFWFPSCCVCTLSNQ